MTESNAALLAILSDTNAVTSDDSKTRYWIVCPHPHCGKRLLVSASLEGRAVRCPTCGKMMRVPQLPKGQ